MTVPTIVPIPTPMNMRPFLAIVKLRLSIKIIGNASNTGRDSCPKLNIKTRRKKKMIAYVQIADHILWKNK